MLAPAEPEIGEMARPTADETWALFLGMTQCERAQFMRWLVDWQHERDHGEPAPPVQRLADAMAAVEL